MTMSTNQTSANPTPYTIVVPAEALSAIIHRFGLFARRCVKLGLAEPSLVTGAHSFIPDPRGTGRSSHAIPSPLLEMVELTLLAPPVMALGGWRLAGRVDRLPDGSPLIARTPGTQAIMLPDIRDAGDCQHCRKTRVRTETFLVAHEDGRVAQVGRDCLRDFLGHDPVAALRQARLLDRFTSTWGSGSWSPAPEPFYDTAAVLALAVRVAAHGGYLGNHRAAEINAEIEERNLLRPHAVPTVARVTERLIGPAVMTAGQLGERDQFEREWDERYPDDEAAAALAADTAAGIAEASVHPGSEWEANVAAVVGQPQLRSRHFGVAVSAVLLGLRRQARPPRPPSAPSRHLGTLGARLTLDAEIVFVRDFEGDFGSRTLYKFQAAEGTLTWWTASLPTKPSPPDLVGSSPPPGPWVVGDLVTLTGTVKTHETDRYDGRPVTVLTRVKLTARAAIPVPEPGPDPAEITAILEAIPGAFERAEIGLTDAGSGDVVALEDL